jgi:hypothetical protein
MYLFSNLLESITNSELASLKLEIDLRTGQVLKLANFKLFKFPS